MALTISHVSALELLRALRSKGADFIREFSEVPLGTARPIEGKYWTKRSFSSEDWTWPEPDKKRPLHVVVTEESRGRIRVSGVIAHVSRCGFSGRTALWLDEHASIVSPELLYLQMAETMSLPSLVMLGYELCGSFSRDPSNPLRGEVKLGVPPATTVEKLSIFLQAIPPKDHVRGVKKARKALEYVCDHAVSLPEALLATIWSLPPGECGYGMRPITLNKRVPIHEELRSGSSASRYPDIVFTFAPIGINYEGSGHFDLEQIVVAARADVSPDSEGHQHETRPLSLVLDDFRAKMVDDARRDRELAAEGVVTFRVLKEDLYEYGALDRVTAQVLSFARRFFNADTTRFEETLNDHERALDRYALLTSMLPGSARMPGRGTI